MKGVFLILKIIWKSPHPLYIHPVFPSPTLDSEVSVSHSDHILADNIFNVNQIYAKVHKRPKHLTIWGKGGLVFF